MISSGQACAVAIAKHTSGGKMRERHANNGDSRERAAYGSGWLALAFTELLWDVLGIAEDDGDATLAFVAIALVEAT